MMLGNESTSAWQSGVYVGLGSNLNNPSDQVQRGLKALDDAAGIRLCRASSLYTSPPLGPRSQADYVNAVAELSTQLSPEDLLRQMQALEQTQGRIRTGERWGPRTLDLDLLLYGEHLKQTDFLTLPHPRIQQRAFVLYPLAEIAPLDLIIPQYGSLRELLALCPKDGLSGMDS